METGQFFSNPYLRQRLHALNNFLKKDNTFLSLDELIRKVKISIPFTLYYGLVAVIPTEWKNILNKKNSHLNAPLEDLPSTRVAYSTLLTNNVSPPTSENRILNYGFSKESIHKVYTLPVLITKDSKLIAFQFKIIHHILPTKSSLFRAGITESDICSLCATEKQTINHLPYYCTVSKAFWDRFTSWWYQKFKQVVSLTECPESNILYGWHNNIKNKQALKVTMHLQGCLACKRCSASGLNYTYLNPYIKLKLIGLAIRQYQKFWKKWIVEFFPTPKSECLNHLLSVPCQSEFCFSLI